MDNVKRFFGDYDKRQLLSAREQLDDLIKEKEDQEKKIIWRVSEPRGMCLGNFPEDQYIRAVEFLMKEAKKRAEEMEKCEGADRYDLHLEIYSFLVSEDEYPEYINGWERQ
jgi:hypothetical protein